MFLFRLLVFRWGLGGLIFLVMINVGWSDPVDGGGKNGFLFASAAFETNRNLVRHKSAQREALVIGNADYSVAPLSNPVHDAKDMAKALTGLGFNVTQLINATRREMKQGIRDFGKRLRRSEVGLFYYAGHGMQANGHNYLIPVDADIEQEYEINLEAIDANRILAEMEQAGNRLNMVFLDACRDNPYKRSFRSTNKGLAQMQAPSGTLLAYATAPGQVAADGMGRNGIFTKHLLKHIHTPELAIETVLKKVRIGVKEETQGRQMTWQHSSLMGDFVFLTQDTVFDEDIHTLDKDDESKPLLSRTKVTGRLSVKTQPSRAKVYINDVYKGRSPLDLDLPLAVVRVRATKQGYQTAQEMVQVRRDRAMESTLLLSETVTTGRVEVRSQPQSAHWYLDGVLVGETPDKMDSIKPGRHAVTMVAEGFSPWEGTIEVSQGQTTEVVAKLQASLEDERMFRTTLANDRREIFMESIFVSSTTQSPTTSRLPLNPSKKYRLEVSGTYEAGASIISDADYSLTRDSAGDFWTDRVTKYEKYGEKLLNLLVSGYGNSGSIEWGAFSNSHVYSSIINGEGSPIQFVIYDIYDKNNSGGLTVKIFEIMSPLN